MAYYYILRSSYQILSDPKPGIKRIRYWIIVCTYDKEFMDGIAWIKNLERVSWLVFWLYRLGFIK